ncbi:MAG: hypothetical protein IPP64_08645 [Bacteroidetes bacterium]|nr:hypothetical protein [Bacteroidota bacterium]
MASRLFQFFIGITFLLFFTSSVSAQVGDTLIKNDSLTVIKTTTITSDSIPSVTLNKKPYHSPRKAALLSAILPGAGQVYNKKYWKLPIIYAGAAGLTYSFQFNHSRYVKYRNAYKYRIDDDASTTDDYIGVYTDDNLNTLQKYYHRYRDLTVIGFAALYALNIIDASVDAHLFTFDVSDDLTMNVAPTFINTTGMNHYTTGINFSLSFKTESRNLNRLRLE